VSRNGNKTHDGARRLESDKCTPKPLADGIHEEQTHHQAMPKLRSASFHQSCERTCQTMATQIMMVQVGQGHIDTQPRRVHEEQKHHQIMPRLTSASCHQSCIDFAMTIAKMGQQMATQIMMVQVGQGHLDTQPRLVHEEQKHHQIMPTLTSASCHQSRIDFAMTIAKMPIVLIPARSTPLLTDVVAPEPPALMPPAHGA